MALDDFIRDHAGQLKHWRVPEALYEQVYQKLTNEVFDAGSAFMFAHEEAEEEGAPPSLAVFCSRPEGLAACSDVFLIDHAWTFRSKVVAKAQLLEVPSLLERMVALMQLDVDWQTQPEQAAEAVILNLYRYGHQYEFVGDGTTHANQPDTDAVEGTVDIKASERCCGSEGLRC